MNTVSVYNLTLKKKGERGGGGGARGRGGKEGGRGGGRERENTFCRFSEHVER